MAGRLRVPQLREYRELKRAHPELEAYELWAMAGYDRLMDQANAPWADGRASPKPAFTTKDPRRFD